MVIDGYIKLEDILENVRIEIDYADIEEINGIDYVHKDTLEEIKQDMKEKETIGDLLKDISGDEMEIRFEFDPDFLEDWEE